jgi:ABC-type lipoprotein export system ATPase subunit
VSPRGSQMPGALVQVRRLTHVYQTGPEEVAALRGMDLQVGVGERVAIMGRSGSGKTTLLNILAGLETPTEGQVTVGGHDLTRLGGSARGVYRRRIVGYVWQQPEAGLLPALTVLQNVLVPMLAESGSRRERTDAAVQLLDTLGLGGRLDDRLDRLSPVQTERLALAIALANRPLLLLADELTAGFEWPTARELLGDLQALLRATSTAAVVVTHDPRVQRYVDRVVMIRDGVAVPEAPTVPALRGRS